MAICNLHAMAEGARLTMLYAESLQNDVSGWISGSTFVQYVSGLICCYQWQSVHSPAKNRIFLAGRIKKYFHRIKHNNFLG